MYPLRHYRFVCDYVMQEADASSHPCENGTDIDGLESASNLSSKLLDPMSPFSPRIDFDDGDIDDELDPAMKEELDRFVKLLLICIFLLHSCVRVGSACDYTSCLSAYSLT